MVKKIIAGEKTQTRRALGERPEWLTTGELEREGGNDGGPWFWRSADGLEERDPVLACPYGVKGDRLWVRERCWIWGRWRRNGKTKAGKPAWKFEATNDRLDLCALWPQVLYEQPTESIAKRDGRGFWGWVCRPGIFMPRWACRRYLKITRVRFDRLDEIDERDVRAEGMEITFGDEHPLTQEERDEIASARFVSGFQKLNGFTEDATEIWVWVIDFKPVKVRP